MGTEMERHEREIREFLAKEPFCLHNIPHESIRLFIAAFTHDSFTEEYNKKNPPVESYERLEFLGDAVLEFIVCDEAYRIKELSSEGRMTNDFKQKAVSNAKIVEYLYMAGADPGDVMLLGNAFRSKNGSEISDDMRSDVFEALLAATYLTFGLECARALVRKIILMPLIDASGLSESEDIRF